MELERIEAVVREAMRSLIVSHWELAALDVGERSITSHLFRYIANQLEESEYFVDHEYNRYFDLTKSLTFRKGDDLGDRRIFPDIIVHRRNRDDFNLLALEAKKAHNTDADDLEKVTALLSRHEYMYRYGLLLALGITPLSGDGPGETERPYRAWAPTWKWLSLDASTGRVETGHEGQVFGAGEIDRLNDQGWERFRSTQP